MYVGGFCSADSQGGRVEATWAVDRENLSKRPFLDLAPFPTPSLVGLFDLYILWHVDPLLDNDRERSSYTTAATE
jgi:hypothetical protein